MSGADLTELPGRIEALLRGTRETVCTAFAKEPDWELKSDGSAVTALDYALERQIGDALLAMDPDWGVVGEESGVLRPGHLAWHLDPVDGTANFSRRSTQFASQLALVDGTDVLFGAVYEPLIDDYTYACAGAGAYREGRRLTPADTDPSAAVIYADVSHTGVFTDRPELLSTLRAAFYKVRMLGSVALHLRNVACGVADAFVSGRGYQIPMHDLAPGVLICREAGRLVTDAEGGDVLAARRTIVAATPTVHEQICRILRAG